MLFSIRQRCVADIISYILIITFLWSNVVWAGGVECYKLSPSSQITALVPMADTFTIGQDTVRRLTKDGVRTKEAFYRKIREELRNGRIEYLAGYPCLVFSDKDDSEKLSYYVFNPKEPYFSRITTHPTVNDPFWQVFNGAGVSISSERLEFYIDGKRYYQEIYAITDGESGFINTCLDELYPRHDDKLADMLRKKVLEMVYNAKSGHIGGSFSCAEIISVLYGSVMRYDPKNPQWEDRDRFVLSKGHAAPILYAVLGLAGFFSEEEFNRLRKIDALLQGHPKIEIPGVECSTGRLGQGLSFAAGIALSAKRMGKDYRTYVLIGDGEFNEGQIKEAAEHIPSLGLDNITAILDLNEYSIDGHISRVSKVDQVKFWEACGWNVISVDGHNVRELLDAFNKAKMVKGKPTIIIAHTKKGKGAISIEAEPVKYHGKVPPKDVYESVMEEIKGRLGGFTEEDARRMLKRRIFCGKEQQQAVALQGVERIRYKQGSNIATREAFGSYLLRIAEKNENVYAGSTDLTDSVGLAKFSKDYPGRFIPFGIHEAHMAGVAGGLASTGIIPFIATFDVFSEEMSTVITMIDQMKLPVVFVHTHSGIGVGEDGVSHQSRTEPLKMLDLPNTYYFEPADAKETEECLDIIMEMALKGDGPFYLRLTRQKVPIINMPFGPHTRDGAYCVYDNRPLGDEKSSYIFIAAGAMVSECIKSAEVLKEKGIYGKVINMPRPDYVEKNPNILVFLLEKGVPIFTVHDATPRILGSVVNGIVARNEDLQPITVKNIGIPGWVESGSTEDLYKKYGLSSDRLVSAVRDEIVGLRLKELRRYFDEHRKKKTLTPDITHRIADASANLFMDVYKDEGRMLIEAINIVGEIISLDDESLAKPGISAMFGRIVEALNDTFLFENRRISMQVMARVTWIIANSPEGKLVKDTLAGFGINSEEQLLNRAYKAIEERRFNGGSGKVKKIIVFSRITKGADVAINSIIMERLKSIFPNAEIVLLGIPKDKELFGGDSRIRIEEIDYERRGTFISRLNSWANVVNKIKEETQGMDKGEYIVIDADTRVSQVGVLPCTDGLDNYFFLLSTLGVAGNTLGEVVNNWMDRVFGKSGFTPLHPEGPSLQTGDERQIKDSSLEKPRSLGRGVTGFTYPTLSLKEEDKIFASQVKGKLKDRYLISISVGAGGVDKKKLGKEFDLELIERLLELTDNVTILLDKGTEEYNEPPYVTELVDELRRRGNAIVDANNLTEGVTPDIVTWHGSLGRFAGLIGISDQYVGYDSCFGHVAGALGIPETIIFAGHPNNIFLTRWTPLNPQDIEIVEVQDNRGDDRKGIIDEVVKSCLNMDKREMILKDFVESEELFESEHVRMYYDRYSNSINIQVFQDIKDLYTDTLDNTLFIYIDLTEDYRIKGIRLLGFQHPLSLLTLSVFLEKVGFDKRFPIIFKALRGKFNLPRDIEGLADYTGRDIAIYSDVAGLTHRTLSEDLTRDLGCSLRMLDFTKVSLKDIIEKVDFNDGILYKSDNIAMQYNKENNMVLIEIKGGEDRLEIYISLAEDYTIKDIKASYSLYALSRSTVSLIFNRTDFANRFPLIFSLIKEQFVLPSPTEEISLQEVVANSLIGFNRYEEMISKGIVDRGLILELSLLRYSKSWEIRRKALKMLQYLKGKGYISPEGLKRFEGLFLREDIKEDTRQIERLLRNNTDYVRNTFKNLFGRDITLSEIYNSEVNIRYVGRGFNKQIYKVEWKISSDDVYIFVISTIRDAQIDQGDFSASRINSMLKNWKRLSEVDNPCAPRLGVAVWEEDYRPKNVELAGYPEKIVKDNIMFVSREFIEGVNLEQVLSDANIPEEEKSKARLAGLKALLGIWRFSRDKDGKGIFMTTPKPDDVVIYKSSDGQWQAKVVDLDALEDGIIVDRIVEIFKLYPWCPIGLVKRLLYCDSLEGPRVVSIGGGNGPRRLAIGMAGYTKNVTNVITVFDNGGSTGIFRDCLDMPAVGDIRNRICALLYRIEAGAVLESIFDYRVPSDKEQDELIEELKEIFSKKEEETGVAIPKNIREELKRIISYYIDNYSDKVPLRGMSVGNIILAGEYFRCDKNLAKAVSNILKILGLDRIMDMIPITSANLDIAARVGNNIVYGEHQIAHRENPELRIWGMFFTERGKIDKVPPPEANPVVLKKIEEADAVVIGPGSLHTSCIPNLMVKGVPEAIRKSRGAKILVVNLLEYNEREGIWETRYYRASQIVEEVLRVLGGIGGLYTDYVQYVLVNNHGDKKGYIPVDLSELNKMGLEVIVKDLEDKNSPGYHDPKKLSQAIMEIIEKHRNPTSEDLVKELRRLHSDTTPVGVNAYYNIEDLYNKALEIYMKIIEICNDPVILLEAWRVLTKYQRYVIDHFDGYGVARTQELRGPNVLELQQRMLDKIRAVRDFSSSEVAAEIDNNVRFFGYLEPEKLVFFNILLNPNGNAQFKAIPSKVMTYSVTIPPEGPHADVGYVGITRIETKLESGGFIRGTIEGYAYDEKGFVRLDPPIGDFDIEAFLKKKLGKDQLSPKDYTKYEQILLDEIIEVVKFLSNGINLNKRLILYDSVRRMFRRYGIVIPGEVGLGRFIKLISGISEGIAREASKTEEVAGLEDMLKDDVVIKNPLGLHARVAARIVRFVSEFKGLKIFIKKGGKIADAGSLSELIEIAGEAGDKVQILVGRDAERRQEAVDGIKRILDKEVVSILEIKAVPEDISEDALVVRGSVKGLMHPGLIGNKGFGLLELAEQSPVPETMFVTGVAYDLFVKESGLNPLIKQFEQLYERYNAEEDIKEKRQIFTDINRKAREIREAVISREMPSKIKDMIKTEYRKLCSETGVENLAVAVRSSSTLEDILRASFAGIYESFLCVSGEEEIIKAVKNVWASLFSERAVKYIANLIDERRDTLPYSRIRQAVVIQRMIAPVVSGVAYTVDGSIIYIEASCGVGKQIVNGKVTPDRWLVKKKEGSFEIVKQHMGKVNQERLCLMQEQIINLARDMDKIAGYYRDKYGYNNMNVEFAFDKNEKPYFLQARPLEGINLCLEEQSEVGDFIHGIGVCRGTAEGRIVYAKGIEDLPKEGSGSYILLCDYADSSALKILFEALDRRGVVGVITLTGGKTSHFSALVREIGIPCVSGIGSIGDLKQGELVRINGQNGTIEILSIERLYELVKNLGDVLFLNLDEYFEKEGIDSPREKIRYLLKQQMEIGFVRGMELGSVEYIDFSYRIGDKIIPMRVQFNPRRVDRFRDAKIVFAELAWKERLLAEAGGKAEGFFRKLSEVEIDQGKLQKMEQMVEEIKTISSRMKEIIAAKAERQKGKRQCNLCREWQVEVEKGFSFRNFIVYPNPFPYVDGLVTIAYKDHIPQTAFDLESMMGFAKTAGYKVLFNSQNAGPTIPEHAHFQAFPASKILPAEIVGRERLKEDDGIEIFELDKDYPVKMLVVEGKNKRKVNRNVRNIIRYLEKSGFGYNLLIKEENGRYQVYIVPRLAEQPSEYFSKFATFEMFGELVSVYKKEELFRKLGEEEFKKVIIGALQKATISSDDYERLCSFVKGGEIYTHKLVKEEDVLVIDPLGIHAKSAIDIVNIADRYKDTELYIESDGKRADGRSRKDLLRLGIGRGEGGRIVAEGPDAERLLEELKGLRNLFRFKDDTGGFIMPDTEGEELEDTLLLGGKGANLDRLAGIDGMNIPEWFSINSEDYENFIRQNNIGLLVDELNEKIIRGEDVSGQLEEIRHAISVADMPAYLKEKITQGYMEMAGKSGKDKIEVAVRSSVIGEDTEAISSAGIYDTVFAYDEDSLLIAVKKCWVALYKKEAYHYRRQRKLNEMGLKMGVIVQRKIVPEYYGTITNLFIEGEEYYLVELVWHKISKKGVVGGEENPQCFLISAKGGIRPEFYYSWHEHTIKMFFNESYYQDIARIRNKFKFKGIQIEFAIDKKGKRYTLQVRPSKPASFDSIINFDRPICSLKDLRMLPISPGEARGRVVYVMRQKDLPRADDAPYILLTDFANDTATSLLLEALDRGNVLGVITMVGGYSSHFATVVREAGIPYVSLCTSREWSREIEEDVKRILRYDEVYFNASQGVIRYMYAENRADETFKETRDFLCSHWFMEKDLAGVNTVKGLVERVIGMCRGYESNREKFAGMWTKGIVEDMYCLSFLANNERQLKEIMMICLEEVKEEKYCNRKLAFYAICRIIDLNQDKFPGLLDTSFVEAICDTYIKVARSRWDYGDGVTIMGGFSDQLHQSIPFAIRNAPLFIWKRILAFARKYPGTIDTGKIGEIKRRCFVQMLNDVMEISEDDTALFNIIIEEDDIVDFDIIPGKFKVYLVHDQGIGEGRQELDYNSIKRLRGLRGTFCKGEGGFVRLDFDEDRDGEDVIKDIFTVVRVLVKDFDEDMEVVLSERVKGLFVRYNFSLPPKITLGCLHNMVEQSKAPCPSPVAGPVGKKVQRGVSYDKLWEAEIIGAKVMGWRPLDDAGKKAEIIPEQFNEPLNKALSELIKVYGLGIIALVDRIRLVDNIDAETLISGQEGILPYGMMVKEEGKNILLLDIDAFRNTQVLYIVLEHELKESIMRVVPCENEATREITTNYMSLELGLKMIREGRLNLEEFMKILPQLGADEQFFKALEVLQAMVESGREVTYNNIIAAAIEHMRAMPYYARVFQELPSSLRDVWERDVGNKVYEGVDRYIAALEVFNDIMETKVGVDGVEKKDAQAGLSDTVKEVDINIKVINTFTGKMRIMGLEGLPRRLQHMIGVETKQIHSTDRLAGQFTKSTDKRYILVHSEDRLKELIGVIGEDEYKYMVEVLSRNNYEVCTDSSQIPEGASVIRLVDPAGIEKMPKDRRMLYLPMPYTRSSFYMAANILQAGGKAEDVDSLVKGFVREFYRQIIGDIVEDDNELQKLFTMPWEFLPEIRSVLGDLNSLRTAILQIEKAA